ncbi:hypothetical protein M3J09_007982 [Ascochyta lentis]
MRGSGQGSCLPPLVPKALRPAVAARSSKSSHGQRD